MWLDAHHYVKFQDTERGTVQDTYTNSRDVTISKAEYRVGRGERQREKESRRSKPVESLVKMLLFGTDHMNKWKRYKM